MTFLTHLWRFLLPTYIFHGASLSATALGFHEWVQQWSDGTLLCFGTTGDAQAVKVENENSYTFVNFSFSGK